MHAFVHCVLKQSRATNSNIKLGVASPTVLEQGSNVIMKANQDNQTWRLYLIIKHHMRLFPGIVLIID